MARLGDLERAVMEILWQRPTALTAREVLAAIPGRDLAPTTVLTVLSRLEGKGFVTRRKDGRAHEYSPTASRADHVATLMHEVLGTADDRVAVLTRFAGGVSPQDAVALQAALDEAVRRGGRRPRGGGP